MLTLDPASSALVLIDLQLGILGHAQTPRTASAVLANAATLAGRWRALKALVVRVRVGFSADGGDMLKLATDQAGPANAGSLPANWLEDPAELPSMPGDVNILKRQWSAFHGTELDLQLRRRGIRTLVLGGLVTAIGVESTARAAWEYGYEVVLVEDLCSAPVEALHAFPLQYTLPRVSRIRSTVQVLAALPG